MDKAATWYQKAAETQNQRVASSALYLHGQLSDKGSLKPLAQAVILYRKAADKGHRKEVYNLGLLYSKGRGVAQNDKEAVKWLLIAAKQDYEYAAGLNAYHFKDYAKALKIWKPLAEHGNVNVQFNLGFMYANGLGT